MAAHFVPEPKMHLPDGLLDPRVELDHTSGRRPDVPEDTIQRRLNSGRSRTRAVGRGSVATLAGSRSGIWSTPVAGCHPGGRPRGAPSAAGRRRDRCAVKPLRAEEERLRLEIEMLRERPADRAEEVAFLRSQITGAERPPERSAPSQWRRR